MIKFYNIKNNLISENKDSLNLKVSNSLKLIVESGLSGIFFRYV